MEKNEYLNLSPYSEKWNHKFIMVNEDVKIHFVRYGGGAPVILLHGWPGFWYDWRYVIPSLSQYCDVIALDFRGFGDSDKPSLPPHEGYTPNHLAADVISLIEKLELKEVILVAHDIGATIAQTVVQKCPSYIKGLVLLNPPYPGIGQRRFDPAIQREFWYQHFHNLPWAGNLIGSSYKNVQLYIKHFYEHWAGDKKKINEKELDYIVDVYSKEGYFDASIAYYKARAAAKTSQAATSSPIHVISHKTCVLWGEEDPVIPSMWSDRLSDYFSNVRLTLLPGIGHFVPFEAPEEVVEAVREFL